MNGFEFYAYGLYRPLVFVAAGGSGLALILRSVGVAKDGKFRKARTLVLYGIGLMLFATVFGITFLPKP